MKHADALAQLAREIARARRAIAAERGARLAIWPVLALALWALIALMGGPDYLPPLAQSLTGIAALAIILTLAVRAVRRWRSPTEAEARARLAADSRLDPAAFEALEDRPSTLDPDALALWKIEQQRAILRADFARARPARLPLNEADPYRLRWLVAAGLVAAAMYAGGEAPGRLARAFYPDPGPLVGDGEIAVEAWLAPEAYTGAAPVSLTDRLGETIDAPPAMTAVVRVTGPRGAPRLIYTTREGREVIRFTRAPDGAYEARIDIRQPGRLRVVRFHERASWRIRPGPDAAPQIAFGEGIEFGADETAMFSWRASDDYGVRELALRVVPIDPPEGLAEAPPYETPLESPAGEPREAEQDVEISLSEHPYAGMQVEARLVARDALGQEGVSEPIRVELPEKVFLQPLAQAAIEIRRMILWERRAYEPARIAPGGPATMPAGDILTGAERIAIRTDDQDPRLERAPAAIRRAARWIDSLTMRPEDGYFADRAVFMGFHLARAELENARDIDETLAAAHVLWLTALRAEYGGAADARRALDAAAAALADALQNGASEQRIAQLTEALRRAMDNYMQALIQEAMRNGQAETQEDTEEQTDLSQRDLQDVLDEIERLTEEGRTEEAQALLEQLAAILQNLEVQLTQGPSGQQSEGGGEEGEQSELEQSMDELSDAMGEQRELNDQTEAAQAQGGNGGDEGQGLAQRQADIRERLNEARGRAGQQSGGAGAEALSRAEQAMRRSEQALRGGDLESARAAQDEAMRNLREGAAELASDIQRQDGENQGEADSEQGQRDPLGRSTGIGDGGETEVPAEGERARSRAILDELRRRAQDPRRPESEREYLRRLLDRFTGS